MNTAYTEILADSSDARSILKAVLSVASIGMTEEALLILQTWLACRTAADPSDRENLRCAKEAREVVLDVMTALCGIELLETADALWKVSSEIWATRTEEWEDADLLP